MGEGGFRIDPHDLSQLDPCSFKLIATTRVSLVPHLSELSLMIFSSQLGYNLPNELCKTNDPGKNSSHVMEFNTDSSSFLRNKTVLDDSSALAVHRDSKTRFDVFIRRTEPKKKNKKSQSDTRQPCQSSNIHGSAASGHTSPTLRRAGSQSPPRHCTPIKPACRNLGSTTAPARPSPSIRRYPSPLWRITWTGRIRAPTPVIRRHSGTHSSLYPTAPTASHSIGNPVVASGVPSVSSAANATGGGPAKTAPRLPRASASTSKAATDG